MRICLCFPCEDIPAWRRAKKRDSAKRAAYRITTETSMYLFANLNTHMHKRVDALNVLCAQRLIHYAHSSKELPTQCLVTMLQLKPATHDCGVIYAASRQFKQQCFIICTSSWVWRQSLIALLCSVLRLDESTKAVGKFVCQCYDVGFVEGKKFSCYRLNHVALPCLNYLRLIRCCAHRL